MIYLRYSKTNSPKSIEETSDIPTDDTKYVSFFESDNINDFNDFSNFNNWVEICGILDIGVEGIDGPNGVDGIP
ncbi:hypothetical protein [Phocaeicola faecalis]